MKLIKELLPGVFVFEADQYRDNRGILEIHLHQDDLSKAVGDRFRVSQTMWAGSRANVIRGLHYQAKPNQVAKLVTCTLGVVFDVVVDLRSASDTYGQWAACELTGSESHLIYVPPGFAHGYMSLSPYSGLFYYQQGFYNKDASRVIYWDDPEIDIDWPLRNDDRPICSERDMNGMSWAEYAQNPDF